MDTIFTAELVDQELAQHLNLEGTFYHVIFLDDLEKEEQTIDAGLMNLQAKDFVKWLRKQVRLFGRKAEVGNAQVCPVEAWAQELGYNVSFICGGEVEVKNEHGVCTHFTTTEWTATSYYMYDEDGLMVTKAGKMLDVALLDVPEAYLIAR